MYYITINIHFKKRFLKIKNDGYYLFCFATHFQKIATIDIITLTLGLDKSAKTTYSSPAPPTIILLLMMSANCVRFSNSVIGNIRTELNTK